MATLGDDLIRWTIRIALALAAIALALRWSRRNGRLPWTVGCLAYLAHVGSAFHFQHHWSHAAAYEATARDTAKLFGFDWGGGLYFNYVFTLMWIADVVWWWMTPKGYEARPRWVDGLVHGFFAFMAINGAIVFATGPTRWVSLAAAVVLAWLWWRSSR